MKRNIRRVLIGLACAAAALVLVGVQKYYPKYRDFREQTNYRFASIADFFYQLGEARLLSYQFSDQDVSDIEVGSQHIRTMEIVTSQGNMYLQAVAVKSAFGTYYRFFDCHYDIDWDLVSTADFSDKLDGFARIKALQLDGGFLFQVIASSYFLDSNGRPLESFRINQDYYFNHSEYPGYLQLFWVEGDELPEGYHLSCLDDSFFSVDYEGLVDSYQRERLYREANR